ncbi:ArsR family transcriptional regulator [Cohnella sp. CFH 77786]|uniref:ArsR family transcriptional regulator n=1 Tax=Cohnella sp. CFH 77786 TaxID=2662265 RepID=UPI001C60E47F|nr:ArsR family transcriptional regulator [Cohnella sp. CFH 77786]MBW5448570.1 ArsR family transcriptional regulator [Cohnella sp. CFH 77786]
MTIKANTDRKWLPLYEALASEVRLRILDVLAKRELNVKEIAASLELSSAIVTMHIRKLEEAGLIGTRRIRRDGGTHKLCFLKEKAVEIDLPAAGGERAFREQSIPVGHYTAFEVYPTCGLATKEKKIGLFDDPRYFLDPERVNAAILWFGRGFVEYKTPNYLHPSQKAEELEISLEISSEAPGVSDHWPSDIRFYFNGVKLGTWTSPGDYGGKQRGRYTPEWWSSDVNQFGLWKTVRVTKSGTYVDGMRISDTTLADLRLEEHFWTLRFAVEEDSEHVGGLTLYGAGFGNYNQDIRLRVYYGEEG